MAGDSGSVEDPACYTTMAEIRAGIDRIDVELVRLLALRAAHIDRAAEIKARDGLRARLEGRVEEVVRNVRAEAERQGLSPELAEDLWRHLIEWSILREEARLGTGGNDPQPAG